MRPVALHVCDYSLDGVIGEEDTELYEFCRAVPEDPAHEAWLASSLERAGVHVVGRVTYEGMARHFPTATGPIADAMNRIPKAVFSRTLKTTHWPETTILNGDLAAEIDALRRQGGGEILAHGGASLVQALARLDLVDEYRLTIYPYLAGTGRPLFTQMATPRRLELTSTTSFPSGLLALTYRRPR